MRATTSTLRLVLPLTGLVALGCASADREPVLLPPVTVTDAAPSPEGEAAAAPVDRQTAPAPIDPSAPIDGAPPAQRDDSSLKVLGRKPEEAPPGTMTEMLQRAARDARENREGRGESVLVINDENISELAEGGRVTLGLADLPPLAGSAGQDGEVGEQERFWRSRVFEIRSKWREAYDSIDPLEAEAAKLRTRFYAEDDPVRRDREIKPQWDRTLDRLAEAQRTLTDAREELAQALDAGRRDGALPGWLREGQELGPFDLEEPAEGEQLDELKSREPPMVELEALEPPP
ncbi:MAG TPA: hypothetical protein VMV46_11130 [Thermoanaerobaculia bacterium]|nr:hypothetical protein [Thermoanaerobaculia bacterium]